MSVNYDSFGIGSVELNHADFEEPDTMNGEAPLLDSG